MRCALAAPTDEGELGRAGGGANEGLKADAGDVDQKSALSCAGIVLLLLLLVVVLLLLLLLLLLVLLLLLLLPAPRSEQET